ncbi:MAG TPA: alpha/beta fold hydrolase [Steroidobacteraceae bacterium]|nr:alpha/beta fold hydrolase [Steroidobacteraceae bacterium]
MHTMIAAGSAARRQGREIFHRSRLSKFILLAAAIATCAHAQAPVGEADPPIHGLATHGASPPAVAHPRVAAGRASSNTTAALHPAISPVPCPEPTASLCGYVTVPLDRNYPEGAQIQIYFEQYPHTNPGPAVSAIMFNFGGPGAGTTPARDLVQSLFAPDTDVHDLLLVDDRGQGLSATINCPDLQLGTADIVPSISACAAQLGLGASRYGTGDVADDMNDVRRALGYDQVDYVGFSYGGADAIAFATRFGAHVRSMVLDAGTGPAMVAAFRRLQLRTHADARMVRLDCQRSLLCAPDHPNPDEEFQQLIDSVREHPVEGDSYDSFGNPLHVVVDEKALLNFIVTYPSGYFTSTGEILAAGAALQRGDPAPLLRLDAEGFTPTPLIGNYGDPTFYSQGDYYAKLCADLKEPYEYNDPVTERKRQYEAAVAALPGDFFAPFSTSAPTGIDFSAGKQCIWWQEPTPPNPMVKPDAAYPSVPVLLLSGDLDNRVPLASVEENAVHFPASTLVVVPEAGHEVINYSTCATNLEISFIETLTTGGVTTCTDVPIWAAVGRFPLLARDARPAAIDRSQSNEIEEHERKVVSVAVATVIDALQRSIIDNYGEASVSGVGLRGGTFQTAYGPAWTVTLTNCRFSEDIVVNGTLTWAADYTISADITLSGPGTGGGTLHISGPPWEAPGSGPVGYFHVSGSLGGKNVAVLVPEE